MSSFMTFSHDASAVIVSCSDVFNDDADDDDDEEEDDDDDDENNNDNVYFSVPQKVTSCVVGFITLWIYYPAPTAKVVGWT